MRGLLVVALGGCGAGEDEAPPPASPLASPAPESPWPQRLSEPRLEDLLAALAQPHAVVRGRVGPHRLTTQTDFSLTPADPAPTPAPPVDSPAVEPQRVHDELTLDWAPSAEHELALRLHQANDHDRGRDVVVIDQVVHVRKAHRAWVHYPRDSAIHEQWLDDAQRSVHDVLELAAPRLAFEATPIDVGGLDGGPAMEITLALAPAPAAPRPGGPTQSWRREAELEAITGRVRLDTQTGAWLEADVDVRYRLTGADLRPLVGRVHLVGAVTPAPDAVVAPPADSQPLPSRLRYDHEQRELLDGLAAP